MGKKYFIGIYWGARKETIDDCMFKVDATFKFLGEIDNSFSKWFRTSKPIKNSTLEPINLNIDGIRHLLITGQNYSDVNHKLLEDLGFLFSVKSEKNYAKAHNLTFTCGSCDKLLSNCITINLSSAEDLQYLTSIEILQNIYDQIVGIWKPEWGVIRCDDIDLLLEKNIQVGK